MKKAIITLLIFLPLTAHAFDPWDRTDKVLAGMYLLATATDWRQTVYIAHHPETTREINPILNEHPSEANVNQYFMASVAIKLLVAQVLPSKWRKVWLGSMFVVSGSLATYNASHGIKIEW